MSDLVKEINEKISEYMDSREQKFVPGETPILTGSAVYDDKEVNAIVNSVLKGWFGLGVKGARFEKAFSKRVGKKYSIYVNSGSSANFLALNGIKTKLGLNDGEVITPACAFPTTVNPIIQLGFKPNFIDIDKSLNVTPEGVAAAINEKTKGIVFAHTLGNPAKVEEIKKIADENNLFLIEDCCDALGSKYKGRDCGAWGDGFIGSNFIYQLRRLYPNTNIINFDKLTYAGNIENLSGIRNDTHYQFICGDIASKKDVTEAFSKHNIDCVVNFAAESHVDRSIHDATPFIRTNVQGTTNLMDAALDKWSGNPDSKLFVHISTDEVYGSLGKTGVFTEETPLSPRNPYSSSKASSDMMVLSYAHTHNFPAVITRCSNNYGPYQFPEKLIPLTIINIIRSKNIPIYGDGRQVRDWIFVADHCDAIERAMRLGRLGEVYNFGGEAETYNIDLVKNLCALCDSAGVGNNSERLMTHVTDRPGHDRRYAMGTLKAKKELGWNPKHNIKDALQITVAWYLENKDWWTNLLSREYEDYYAKQYGEK